MSSVRELPTGYSPLPWAFKEESGYELLKLTRLTLAQGSGKRRDIFLPKVAKRLTTLDRVKHRVIDAIDSYRTRIAT